MVAMPWLRRIALAALVLTAQIQAAPAGTIDTIRANQIVRVAYRDDAPPFSYKGAGSAAPAGFMVELCQAVVKDLAAQLALPKLAVSYVAVTASNRFEAIEKGQADLLCEPTSATLSRRKNVDFSIATFVDGASVVSRDKTLHNLTGLTGLKIGVLAGTTTEDLLRNKLRSLGVNAEIMPAKTHGEGLAMLDSGAVTAYFADRSILMFLLKDSKEPDKLFIADNYLTVEPYALALAHGDEGFRLAVDTALSHIYSSGEITAIFTRAFGDKAQPSEMLQALYLFSTLPD